MNERVSERVRERVSESSAPLSVASWRRLEPLLDAALELPAAERAAFLDAQCGDDALVRAELDRMIADCDSADDRLEGQARQRFAALLGDDASLPRALAERYEVQRELGRGGMATVYLARDARHDRDVAIKMLRPEVGALLGTQRFLAEIRVTARLRHPNILPLFDSGEEDGRLYYVTLFADGGSLRDRLARDGPLAPPRARRVAAQVAHALAEAHTLGVVHRDIKPENILLTRDGEHAYVADFGIALALDRVVDPALGAALGDRATRTGHVIGTRQYMSPEQLRGARDLDGRTDVYSLGCVLYEMLTGELPNDAEAVTASRTLTAATDAATSAVVLRAIAPRRDERFATATDFARALEATTVSAAVRSVSFGGGRATRRAAGVAAAVVATAAAGAFGVRASRGERAVSAATPPAAAAVDPNVIAVLPFRHDRGAGLPSLDGDNCARLLYDRLGRWQNVQLSDEMRVADAQRARGPAELSVDDARALAARVGAGRFVWGAVSTQGGGVMRVSARLYDASRPAPISAVVLVAADGEVEAKFAELADSLVVGLAGAPAAAPPATGTRDFAALKHYADGYAALHGWDTPAAERHFEAAVALDPAFPQASLALAQAMSWSGRYEPAEWREPAAGAVADSARLAPRDRALAAALLALADTRMADACDIYRQLIVRSPRDFAAQYGLGECLSRDRLAVRDAASPTRWRFRASMAEAVRAYVAALALVPSYYEAAHGGAFAALAGRLLATDEGYYRAGYALTPDTLRLGAFPELLNDTLAYRPSPIDAFFRAPAPATHRAAIARNHETMRALTARWTTAFPRSAAARHAYALALEALGTPNLTAALQAAADARRMSRVDSTMDVDARARVAATEVRVLLKLGRVERARVVAESALVDTARVTDDAPRGAEPLAALAALTGRARLAARLLERAAVDTGVTLFWLATGNRRPPPAPALRAAGAFAAYAALALPGDSLRAARDRTERAIAQWSPPRDRARTRALLLARPTMLAQPALGLAALRDLREPESFDDHLALWQSVARADAAGVRRGLASRPPASVVGMVRAPDWLVQRAHIALAIRDTATAVAALDELLASLPDQPVRLTEEFPAAAAVGRSLVLRASLGRSPAAAQNARLLWAHADPELRAMVASLGTR